MRRLTVLAFGLAFFAMAGAPARGTPQASTQANKPAERTKAEEGKAAPKAGATAAKVLPSGFDLEKYFSEMEEDVAVYDPASPWVYEGKGAWRKQVELGDMKVVTVYREIRRVEGSMTSRLHGRITWVYLKQPDGRWFLWHDHTSEIPEDYAYGK
jgi:hypothetical protein